MDPFLLLCPPANLWLIRSHSLALARGRTGTRLAVLDRGKEGGRLSILPFWERERRKRRRRRRPSFVSPRPFPPPPIRKHPQLLLNLDEGEKSLPLPPFFLLAFSGHISLLSPFPAFPLFLPSFPFNDQKWENFRLSSSLRPTDGRRRRRRKRRRKEKAVAIEAGLALPSGPSPLLFTAGHFLVPLFPPPSLFLFLSKFEDFVMLFVGTFLGL